MQGFVEYVQVQGHTVIQHHSLQGTLSGRGKIYVGKPKVYILEAYNHVFVIPVSPRITVLYLV